jgi:hypothetical protein
MPRYPDTPGFRSRQDFDFNDVDDNELVVACGYEYARESVLITALLKEWLRLEKPRAELFQRGREKHIALHDVHRALSNYMKVARLERHMRIYIPERGPTLSQELRERVERDFPAAVKLLSDLSDQFHEVACYERDVEKIESCDGRHVGAPGLRFLANYFVADTPWLLIPKADREGAITNARNHQFIFFRVVPAIESVDELQEKIRKGEALPLTRPGEQDVWLRIRWNRSDTAIDEGLVQWRKQHRPKNKAKGAGRGQRSSSWWLALQELAAMRLSHVLSPQNAIETFRNCYGASVNDSRFWRLRRDCFSTFRQFFGTGEEPRHTKTWAERAKLDL